MALSSRWLADAITAEVPSDDRRVLELGPGTGAFTHALLRSGIPEDTLALVERDPAFARLLRTWFPAATARMRCGSPIARPIANSRQRSAAYLVSPCRGHRSNAFSQGRWNAWRKAPIYSSSPMDRLPSSRNRPVWTILPRASVATFRSTCRRRACIGSPVTIVKADICTLY